MSATTCEPVCSTCNDTHRMWLGERGYVMCTRCPSPCQRCRAGGDGPYCETTPCACDCHGATAQPRPTTNDSRPIVEQVIEDLRGRAEVGARKYGVKLQAHNGRRPLQDAYEEALDFAQYLKQEMVERAKLEAELAAARAALAEHPSANESAKVRGALEELLTAARARRGAAGDDGDYKAQDAANEELDRVLDKLSAEGWR